MSAPRLAESHQSHPYTGAGFTLRPDSAGNVVANKAYSLLLDYYNGDYKPISNVAGPDDGVSAALGADSLPFLMITERSEGYERGLNSVETEVLSAAWVSTSKS
jgi:hypothetical protein